MPRIIPIRDLRDTTKLSEMCNASNEPIFVTKNGYGDMVIMSMRTYEEQLARLNMYTKIMEGKSQADNGQLLDGQSTMEKLRKKYVEQV
ncbi:MAG: hypothetical protein SO373_00870 [Candidatus Borkfalkiaceae bacterium]|nr:hypothetical protein [Christensenellaceae bacterium]